MSMRSRPTLELLVVVAMLVSAGCSSNGNGGASVGAASTSPLTATPTRHGHIVWGRWDAEENLHMSTANADGTNIQPLLPHIGWLGAPNWSPDGRKLAVYVSPPDGLVTGGLVNADGTGFHAFDSPDRTLNVACFEWSPDGDRLACEGFDEDKPWRDGLYTVRSGDGGDLRSVTTRQRVALCGYSPDGSRIAYLEGDQYLTTVNVDGTGRRRVTDRAFDLGCDWSPDGRILAASAGSLYLIGLDGTTSEIPVPGETVNSYGPAFSPDGSSIIFLANTEGELFDVYTMRLDGSEPIQVTDTLGEEDFADWGA
jgi:WD40 repeat protein